jgi:hypothetical protein
MAFVVSHRQTWSHNVVSSTARMRGIRTGNFKDDGLRWLNVEGI